MGYKETVEYLYTLTRPKKPGVDVIQLRLKPMVEALEKLGNPHDNLKIIHVAGTNGKGSTCAMLQSVLEEAGHTAGMFTSPHLIDFRERIQINGELISELDVMNIVKRIQDLNVNLTFFEFITVMAFLYFSEKQVDYAIIETGLGGKLDATNVCTPILVILASIDLDHMEFLGHSIEEITRDKREIIKDNVPVVTTVRNIRVLPLIQEKCTDTNSQFVISYPYSGEVGLKGDFQKINAGMAVEAARMLNIDEHHIVSGIKNVKWPGRCEWVEDNVLLDCAHNPDGLRALSEYVQSKHYSKLIIVFGVTHKKDYKTMFSLLPKADHVIFTRPNIERARDPTTLKDLGDGEVIEDPRDAFKHALSLAKEDDLVLVCGSCYLIGNIKSIIAQTPQILAEAL